MKAKYFFIIAAVAGVGLSSCSDFLTEDPKGQILPGNFFDSQAALDAAVNSLYFNVQQSQCNSNPLIVQCQGDDMTSTTGSNKAAYLSADAFEAPTDEKGLNNLWGWSYNIIQAANLIIDGASDAAGNVARESIDEALGQAYYWRAYAYFNLVRVFGPLPLNLHNIEDGNATPLTPVDKVYELIESDLISAENCNLPVKYSAANKSIGGMNIFISEQAVKSTLAAVYMNMAGYPLNKTEYYAKAADKAKEVVDGVKSGLYPQALASSWADVYSYGNNYNSEIIVGIVYHAQPGGWSSFDSQMTSCHQLGSLGGWGDFLAERYFWSRFPDGPRKDYVYAPKLLSSYQSLRLADDGTEIVGDNILVDWWATLDGKEYDQTNAVVPEYRPMFVGFTVNSTPDNQPLAAPYDPAKPFWSNMCLNKTHQIIRYSEVLCWFAEASARAGLYQGEALAALQEVQQRAYDTMPDVADIAEAAYLEHGYEVAGNAFSLVTRRADEFRMNRLKEAYDYRVGPQATVLVPAGTLTHSVRVKKDADGKIISVEAVEYELAHDVIVREEMPITAPWKDENSIYQIYPTTETEKNPNIHR